MVKKKQKCADNEELYMCCLQIAVAASVILVFIFLFVDIQMMSMLKTLDRDQERVRSLQDEYRQRSQEVIVQEYDCSFINISKLLTNETEYYIGQYNFSLPLINDVWYYNASKNYNNSRWK